MSRGFWYRIIHYRSSSADFRECLNFTFIHSKRIFQTDSASCRGSDAGIVTDETWRKQAKKTFVGMKRIL